MHINNLSSFSNVKNLRFGNGITEAELISKLSELRDLSTEDRINKLNEITVPLKTSSISISDPKPVILEAMKYIPDGDKKYSASRYGTELYRLANYIGAQKNDVMQQLAKAISAHNPRGNFEKAIKGFEPTSCNVCGDFIGKSAALGVVSSDTPSKRYRRNYKKYV